MEWRRIMEDYGGKLDADGILEAQRQPFVRRDEDEGKAASSTTLSLAKGTLSAPCSLAML